MIPLAKPNYDQAEIDAATRVLSGEWLISGPEVEAFEREFASLVGATHAIAVNSGSSALLVAKAALGIQAGDEVVVPNMTFVSTASAGMYLGARPVFCDITLDDYGMDADKLGSCISDKTKAILPVHYAGQSARLDRILDVARAHDVPVIEDAAESHLARFDGACTGTLGLAGIFSFTPSKPMTTGEGGMIVTSDADFAERARSLRSFCDAGKFQWEALGFNFRMPEVLGAIGRVQLRKLPASIERRKALAARYSEAFSKLEGLHVPCARTPEDHNFQLYTLRIDPDVYTIDRDRWIAELAERRCSARLYFPTLHRQGVFSSFPAADPATLPNSIEYDRTAFSLPIFATLSDADQDVVIGAVCDVHEKFAR